MALIYEDKVPASYRSGFIKKVTEISGKIGIKPEELLSRQQAIVLGVMV